MKITVNGPSAAKNGVAKRGVQTQERGGADTRNGASQPVPPVAKTTQLEFGGIPGAHLMVLGLPIGVLAITLICNKDTCDVFTLPKIPTTWSAYFDLTVTLVFIAWVSFHIFIAVLPIGTIATGLPLRDGTKLKYRCNAFIALELSIILFMWMAVTGVPVWVMYDRFLQLAVSVIVFSTVLSLYLYHRAQAAPNKELAAGGNSGNAVYDFFLGKELNPRIGSLDLKFFFELRPGLIGWVMLDFCFIAKACVSDGSPPAALVLITIFHFWYVADALWYEEAILTTMDIVHDGFGFMLAFGDLAWVPFLYSLQARYALEHPVQWSALSLAGFFALHVLGYTIFRGANSQKNDFRKDPNLPRLAHLETLPTASGKRLLVSGWWGLCRHPNYLGDLIMALAWSLPCGFDALLPYFYPVYFLCLLIHRNMRDEEACRHKYGADWDKYCAIVKYRIFPYIY